MAKRKRRISDRGGHLASIVSEGATFTGSLTGNADCVVYGRVEGDCDLRATLVLQEDGSWQGHIVADNVVIAGHVDGDVAARRQLELTETARIRGNVSGDSIAIAEGAVCDGEIHTQSGADINWFAERRRPPFNTTDGAI